MVRTYHLLLVLAALAAAPGAPADDPCSEESWSAERLRAALAAPEDAALAHGAWQAAQAGAVDLAPRLVGRLASAVQRPTPERAWALEQVLLDALVRLGARVDADTLLACLPAHTDTAVLLLVLSADDGLAGLWTAYDRVDPRTANEAWSTVGAALAAFDPDRFRRRLLEEVTLEGTIRVYSPPTRRRSPVPAPAPPPVYETWSEIHPVPEGFPPVGTWQLHHRGGDGRGPVHADVETFAARTLHVERTVSLPRTAEDDRSPQDSRLGWLQAPVLGVQGVRPLYASRECTRTYAGPTPFRRWLLDLQRSQHEAWWATIRALVDTGRLGEAEARALSAPITWRLLDERGDARPPILPLPAPDVPNPYRVPRRSPPTGL